MLVNRRRLTPGASFVLESRECLNKSSTDKTFLADADTELPITDVS